MEKIRTAKINKIKQPTLEVKAKTPKEDLPKCMQVIREACSPKIENIDHPTHYQGHKFEVIDIIEDFELGFNLGNALKYLLRAGKKHEGAMGFCEDLEKAIWYLNRAMGKAK